MHAFCANFVSRKTSEVLLGCFPLVLPLCCRNRRDNFSQNVLPGCGSTGVWTLKILDCEQCFPRCVLRKDLLWLSVLGGTNSRGGAWNEHPLLDLLQIAVHRGWRALAARSWYRRLKQPGATFVQRWSQGGRRSCLARGFCVGWLRPVTCGTAGDCVMCAVGAS